MPYLACASLSVLSPTASADLGQHTPLSHPAQLLVLFQQLVAVAYPAITYLLGGHYYDRTNHPRRRHFPAVFALRQGEVAILEVGPNFVAFDTELVRYPERGEPHYPGPWADRFQATVPFEQLYQLCRKELTKSATVPIPSFIITRRSISATPPPPISTGSMQRLPLLANTRLWPC